MKIIKTEHLSSLSVDKPLLVSMSDSLFLPLIENWIAALSSLEIKNNILIISLDEKSFQKLSSQGIPVIQINSSERTNTLQSKTKITRELVGRGFEVIFSDADAIWRKDCQEILESKNLLSFDLVFSQAFGHPKSIAKKQGFCLCSGFYHVKNRDKNLVFLNSWIRYQQQYPDHCDQAALNLLVYENTSQWSVKNCEKLSFHNLHPERPKREGGDTPIYTSSQLPITTTLTLQDLELSLAVLPFKDFRRGATQAKEDPYMVHIGSGGDVSKKLSEIKQNTPNLWFIK